MQYRVGIAAKSFHPPFSFLRHKQQLLSAAFRVRRSAAQAEARRRPLKLHTQNYEGGRENTDERDRQLCAQQLRKQRVYVHRTYRISRGQAVKRGGSERGASKYWLSASFCLCYLFFFCVKGSGALPPSLPLLPRYSIDSDETNRLSSRRRRTAPTTPLPQRELVQLTRWRVASWATSGIESDTDL